MCVLNPNGKSLLVNLDMYCLDGLNWWKQWPRTVSLIMVRAAQLPKLWEKLQLFFCMGGLDRQRTWMNGPFKKWSYRHTKLEKYIKMAHKQNKPHQNETTVCYCTAYIQKPWSQGSLVSRRFRNIKLHFAGVSVCESK